MFDGTCARIVSHTLLYDQLRAILVENYGSVCTMDVETISDEVPGRRNVYGPLGVPDGLPVP